MNACPRRKDVVCGRAKNVTYHTLSLRLYGSGELSFWRMKRLKIKIHSLIRIYIYIWLVWRYSLRWDFVRVVTAGQNGREENRELSKHFINLQVKNFINVYVSSMMFRAEDILWTQSSAKAVSRSGAVFFGLVSDTSIGCRNEFRSLKRENIVSSHV